MKVRADLADPLRAADVRPAVDEPHDAGRDPRRQRGAAVGLLSLLRTEGGSVGTSMASTIRERRDQFHLARLDDYLGPLNAHVHDYMTKATAGTPPRTYPKS